LNWHKTVDWIDRVQTGEDACLRSLDVDYLYKRKPSPANQRIMMIPAANPADKNRVHQWSWRKANERQA
jgi:hypothetical protein